MADRPIIFSGPMVRAILDGRKTQARHVLNPQVVCHPGMAPSFTWGKFSGLYPDDWFGYGNEIDGALPYRPGDRLDPAIAIPDYPDYCVGISGTVYSRKGGEWRALQTTPTSKGYPAICLCAGGKRRTTNTHVLTCEAFHGPRPSKAHQVRHIDGDQSNGCAANLCWGTQVDNWRDRRAHGNGCEGEKHHAAKFSDEEREHIKWGYEKGLFSQRHASRILGITQSSVQKICVTGKPAPLAQDAPDQSHMRLTLTVTDVRVQRLQEISTSDCFAEGIQRPACLTDPSVPMLGSERTLRDNTVRDFRYLWNSINSKRPGCAWADNPWVVALTFTAERRNIDRGWE